MIGVTRVAIRAKFGIGVIRIAVRAHLTDFEILTIEFGGFSCQYLRQRLTHIARSCGVQHARLWSGHVLKGRELIDDDRVDRLIVGRCWTVACMDRLSLLQVTLSVSKILDILMGRLPMIEIHCWADLLAPTCHGAGTKANYGLTGWSALLLSGTPTHEGASAIAGPSGLASSLASGVGPHSHMLCRLRLELLDSDSLPEDRRADRGVALDVGNISRRDLRLFTETGCTSTLWRFVK